MLSLCHRRPLDSIMTRCVEPEWLDELPATDRRAIQSRRDLRRLNSVMGHARFIANALRAYPNWNGRIIDLGGGDGQFLLKVARSLGKRDVEALLIDRMDLVATATGREFESLGWRLTIKVGDVFEVLAEMPERARVTRPSEPRLSEPKQDSAIMSNLFLHHFDDTRLRRLLGLQSERAGIVIACEPRRSAMALAASRLVGLLGCNAVTRHDAIASVRAGFTNPDLTALWSDAANWSIQERPLGLFSHGFICRIKAG